MAGLHHRGQQHRRQSTDRQSQLGEVAGVLRVEPLARGARRADSPSRPRAHEHGSGLERQQLLARLRRHTGAPSSSRNGDAACPSPSGPARAWPTLDLGFASRCHQNLWPDQPWGRWIRPRDPLIPRPEPPAAPQLSVEFKAPASTTSRKRLAIAPISSGVGSYSAPPHAIRSWARLALASVPHRTTAAAAQSSGALTRKKLVFSLSLIFARPRSCGGRTAVIRGSAREEEYGGPTVDLVLANPERIHYNDPSPPGPRASSGQQWR